MLVLGTSASTAQWTRTSFQSGIPIRCLLESADRVFVACGGGVALYRSTDEGGSWIRSDTGLASGAILALTSFGGSILAAGEGGRLRFDGSWVAMEEVG